MLMRHYSPNRRGVGGRHSEPANPTVARGSPQGWHHAAGTVHILFIVCTVQYSKLILYSMSPPVIKMVWFGYTSQPTVLYIAGEGPVFICQSAYYLPPWLPVWWVGAYRYLPNVLHCMNLYLTYMWILLS